MKRVFRISMLIILLFSAVVLLTAKEESSFDGNDVYGFPLTFFTEYSGMVAGGARPSDFNFLNFIIDLLPVGVLAIFVEWAVGVIVKKAKHVKT